MAQFGSEMPMNDSGGAIEWAVSFRFPVSWDCLSSFGDKVQARAAQPIAPAAFLRPTTKPPEVPPPASRAPRVSVEPADTQLGAKTEWGIVVPKMARSVGRAGQSLLPTGTEEPAFAVAAAGGNVPVADAPSFQAPSFGMTAESSRAGGLRTATLGGKTPVIAVAVAVAVVASVLWMRSKAPANAVQTSPTQAAPKAQQTSPAAVQATGMPQAAAAAAPPIAPISMTKPVTNPVTKPGTKSDSTLANSVAASSVTNPATPTAAKPVTLPRPAGSTDTLSAPGTQSASQAALARAAVVNPAEPTARAQAPIAARTAEPVVTAAAPVARSTAAPLPVPAPSASTSVSPAPAVSTLPAVEPPQSAASQNAVPNTLPNTAPARTIAPAATAPTVAIKTGGQLQQAQLISRKSPVYPILAARARVEGTVVLDATVGTDGRLKNIKILQGHPLLQSAAIDAVKQWIYKPATLNGIVTESDTHLELTFGRTK